MQRGWITHDSSPPTEASALTKASATSCVYGPSCVVVDTDQEGIERPEVVAARVVDKRQKRPTASASCFFLFRPCRKWFGLPMIPRHPLKQQQ